MVYLDPQKESRRTILAIKLQSPLGNQVSCGTYSQQCHNAILGCVAHNQNSYMDKKDIIPQNWEKGPSRTKWRTMSQGCEKSTDCRMRLLNKCSFLQPGATKYYSITYYPIQNSPLGYKMHCKCPDHHHQKDLPWSSATLKKPLIAQQVWCFFPTLGFIGSFTSAGSADTCLSWRHLWQSQLKSQFTMDWPQLQFLAQDQIQPSSRCFQSFVAFWVAGKCHASLLPSSPMIKGVSSTTAVAECKTPRKHI